MSLLGKKWIIKSTDTTLPLYERLLKNRGFESDLDATNFLYPTREKDFHDPFLMKDMQRAVDRIFLAITNQERIMIFGDYDVDGITGSAILIRTLKALDASVSCRLPNRLTDGYGLRKSFIDDFAKLDIKLIITVDNGVSCIDEVEYAREKGIDVIISDHHTVPKELPKALAILHPKLPGDTYPFSELTGAGVALKLAQALTKSEALIDDLLDLACLGTVADMGELRGENRYIVKHGLERLANTRWPGLSRLKENAGITGKITTETVGFMICPRINAAGRMSDPTDALRLLIHEGAGIEALANNLDLLNRNRQDLMQTLIDLADIEAQAQLNNPVIIVCNEAFHGGIIGLIAARMCEKYNRPAIAMEVRGNLLIGSCRSVFGVSIVEALGKTSGVLGHFGGHAGAAGFDMSIENQAVFREQMNAIMALAMENRDPIPLLGIDTVLTEKEISFESLNIVELLEPFGMGNAAPLFLCTDLGVHDVMTVGKENTHLKLRIRTKGNLGQPSIIDAIGFKMGHLYEQVRTASRVSLACELDKNVWNNTTKLQLKIKDIAV